MNIRPATAEEGTIVAAVRVASWRSAYRGIVPDSFLATMDSNEEQWCKVASGSERGTQLLVCAVDDRIVGFACFGTARLPSFDFSAELYAIYFLPDMIGRGRGAAMMLKAMDGVRELGHRDMMLWVIENNARARRFYEKFGGVEVSNSRRSFEIDGVTIWEVAYGFHQLHVPAETR